MSFHEEFDPEFDDFPADVQDELLAVAAAVRELGPAAGRPHVGTFGESETSQYERASLQSK